MVREERAHQDDHLILHGDEDAKGAGLVEKWLQDLRGRIPEGAVLSATVRMRPHQGYFASFRLLSEGETISSEARAESAEAAVEEAGRGLSQHLPFSADSEPEVPLAG